MAIFDVIESVDMGPDAIVQRWPAVGSGEIKLGSQLIVRENQWGVFFRDGKGYDVFDAGRHTLTTGNVPLLIDLVGKHITDGSPFKTEVYFVNKRPIRDLKWGTAEPILFRDKELAMVRLRSIITARLQDVLGEVLTSVLDLAAKYDELGSAMKSRVRDDFGKYGIEVTDFYVNAITPPPEVQKVIDERTGMAAVGNLEQYYRFKAAKAVEKASEQSGGGAGEGMGMGVGLGMGLSMAQMMGGAMRTTTEQPCPKCNQPMPTGSNFCPSCGNKIGLPDETLIICPKCQADNPAKAKFCGSCGEELLVAGHCPKCGEAVDEADKFCPECGETLKK